MRALARLVAMKGQFGHEAAQTTARLLETAGQLRLREPADLILLHETALFLRAYPQSAKVLRLADQLLFSFHRRLKRIDLSAFEDPEVSGVAGTGLSTNFSHEYASSLVSRHGSALRIDWDAFERPDRLAPVLAKLLPASFEDWSVEPHIDWRSWFDAAHCSLPWLLARVDSRTYDALEIPLRWEVGSSAAARSHTRLAFHANAGPIFYHESPLLKRSDISLEQEFLSPAISVKRIPPARARKVMDAIIDTSAVRYRELWGFCHPDYARFYHAVFGRGVDFYYCGVPKEWRLPFRAYHSGMYFKNGVPIGYFEGLSFFERMEAGFNLYYTFREGETAWLYARTLKLFRERLGITCFTVDPYQLGDENEEAIASGAYWFYRKLGFQPVTSEIAGLSAKEEEKIRNRPGYRTPAATLRRLARMPLVLGAAPEWGHFSLRKLGQKIERGTGQSAWESLLARIPSERNKKILRAKMAPEETGYLHLLQKSPRLRRQVLRLGRD
jgi:hypothetical protein